MTCVISYKDEDGNIYMGGDSVFIADDQLFTLGHPKIFVKEKMIFGFSGLLRINQAIQYTFDFPMHTSGMEDIKYLYLFISSLLIHLQESGFAQMDSAFDEGSFLIGYNKNIYLITEDFQILQTNKNYVATGIGGDFAIGSFYILENQILDPTLRLKIVLDGLSEFSFNKKSYTILKLDCQGNSGKKLVSINKKD